MIIDTTLDFEISHPQKNSKKLIFSKKQKIYIGVKIGVFDAAKYTGVVCF